MRNNPLADAEKQRLTEIHHVIKELKRSISGDAADAEEDEKLLSVVQKLLDEKNRILAAARQRHFDMLPDKSPESVLMRLMDVLPDAVDQVCDELHAEMRADDPDELLDPAEVNRIVQTELKPYFDYLRANSPSNEYTNAVNYLLNLLSDPIRFRSMPAVPQGDSYTSLTTSLVAVDTDAPAPPTHLISPSDNVTNYTFKPRPTIDVKEHEVPTYRGFTTVLSVEFENDEAVSISSGSPKLTNFDRFVHDAICTLFITDNPNMEPRNITPTMIYRVITGKPGSRIPPKQGAQIEQSIGKLRRTNISIKESNTGGTDTQEISSHLINGMYGRRTFYGHVATVLRITEVPILFSYAAVKKQISRAPIDLFRIEGVANYSTDFILVMQYLWRRINAMRSSATLSRVIRFESIYENVDLLTDLKPGALANKKKAIREHTRVILDSWTETHGFIRDYVFRTKGREYISVEVVIDTTDALNDADFAKGLGLPESING